MLGQPQAFPPLPSPHHGTLPLCRDTTSPMASLSAGSQHCLQSLSQAGAEYMGPSFFSPGSFVLQQLSLQQACVLWQFLTPICLNKKHTSSYYIYKSYASIGQSYHYPILFLRCETPWYLWLL